MNIGELEKNLKARNKKAAAEGGLFKILHPCVFSRCNAQRARSE